jgi:outer membrane protein assembly factor BamB
MNIRIFARLGLALGLLSVMPRASAADNWPQWRGPQSNGVAVEGEYPVKFSADEGVAWKIALPGLGMSTPAVWGDRIFVTCGIDGEDGVIAYDFAGNELWRKEFGPERPGKNRNASGSNPSPVTDGEHVVVYYKSGTLAGLDIAGKLLWNINLQEKYGADTLWWDLATSPVLAGDRVIIAVMQDGDSYLAAFNVATGEEIWKQKRQYERPKESDQSYTTPQLAKVDGRDVVVTWGADHLTTHDVATGELVSQYSGFNPDDQGMWRVIASQAVGDNIAVIPFGRGKQVSAVQLGDKGEFDSKFLWEKRDLGADVPTPVIESGKVYLLGDSGELACLDLKSGDELWKDNLPRNRSKYYASPVLAGRNLYCVREDGVVFVVDVSDGFKLLSENKMGEKIIATPVPVRNGLLIRGEQHLFRIGGEAGAHGQPAG